MHLVLNYEIMSLQKNPNYDTLITLYRHYVLKNLYFKVLFTFSYGVFSSDYF